MYQVTLSPPPQFTRRYEFPRGMHGKANHVVDMANVEGLRATLKVVDHTERRRVVHDLPVRRVAEVVAAVECAIPVHPLQF